MSQEQKSMKQQQMMKREQDESSLEKCFIFIFIIHLQEIIFSRPVALSPCLLYTHLRPQG